MECFAHHAAYRPILELNVLIDWHRRLSGVLRMKTCLSDVLKFFGNNRQEEFSLAFYLLIMKVMENGFGCKVLNALCVV